MQASWLVRVSGPTPLVADPLGNADLSGGSHRAGHPGQIVRDAIESQIDHKVLRRVLAREKSVRRELIEKLEAAK
jgi:hypothetical protein